MRFGVGPDAQGELAGLCQRLDQLDTVGKAVRVGRKGRCTVFGIPAQGDNIGHPDLGKAVGDLKRLGLAGPHAGQMRGNRQARGAAQHMGRIMGQVAGRPARTVGHGKETWGQWCQGLRRVPKTERRVHGFGRKDFE